MSRTPGVPAVLAVLAGLVAGAGLTACTQTEPEPAELTVFAASSLTNPVTTIAEQYETAYPGRPVRLAFGGSADLVAQVTQGAPADVLLTADDATMRKAVQAGVVAGSPTPVATNSLTIAVPPGNPAGVRGFADLGSEGVQVVVCAPQVPCGAAAQRVQRRTGVTLRPVSEEQSVTDVLNKVATGEADAGIVYVTDVRAARGRVDGVAIPARDNAVNRSQVAVMTESDHPIEAAEFRSLLVGEVGRQVLTAAGFKVPR